MFSSLITRGYCQEYYDDYEYYDDSEVEMIAESFIAPVEERSEDNFQPIFNTEEIEEEHDQSVEIISPEDFGIFSILGPPPPPPPSSSLPLEPASSENVFAEPSVNHEILPNIAETTSQHSLGVTERAESVNNDSTPKSNQIKLGNSSQDEDMIMVTQDQQCPGGELQSCVDVCVPLPQLRAYGLCVKECSDRCE